VLTLDAFLDLGAAQDMAAYEAASAAAGPDDVVTYIYTSGTTGKPKGVVLTHGCALAEAEALSDALPIDENDSTLMFLPLAHVFARALHWSQLRVGYVTAFAESILTVVDDLGQTRPTFFAAVPRIYEKFHQGVMAKVQAQEGPKRALALTALEAAMAKVEAEQAERGLGLGDTLKLSLLGGAVGKISAGLQALTGGQIKFFISGGAPLSREIAVFLTALGFNVLEGYGLTETTAATHINRVGACRLGTVGQTVKGVECKIAADGEVCVRGPVVMRGYHERPEATAEVLEADGWFHTGDIGEIDADGFLKITDRKKDIIVTAAGKNIAPQNVENHVKTHPLISQVALFGDQMKFCVALIAVEEEAARKALKDAGAQVPKTYEGLSQHALVRELVEAAIAEKNAELPSYQTIKYFELLPRDFVIGEELTPTLKVKRRVVKERYGDLVSRRSRSAQPPLSQAPLRSEAGSKVKVTSCSPAGTNTPRRATSAGTIGLAASPSILATHPG
jgi:long-chain acyl-CoA synthetase